MTAKVPRTPPNLHAVTEPDDLRTLEATTLWRIHTTIGPYRSGWDEFRTAGPLNSRWEPHPTPFGDYAPTGVIYASLDTTTCFAEVFQSTRVIEASRGRTLSGWTPRRPLRLLDLTSHWPIRNGAAAALHAAPRSTTRAWTRWIVAEYPDLDGVYAPSTMSGRPIVALFSPQASASMPARPDFTRSLDYGAVAPYITAAAATLGWGFRAVVQDS